MSGMLLVFLLSYLPLQVPKVQTFHRRVMILRKSLFVGNFFLARSHKYPVSSCGRAPDCSAGGRGFEPQTGPTLRVLKKLLSRTCCLCNYICKWLDVQVFSDKDYKP